MVVLDSSDLVGWGAFGVLLTAYVISKVIKIEAEAKQIRQDVEGFALKLNSSIEYLSDFELPSVNINEIKEEIIDVVEDFVGNLEAPRWQDHLFGMAQQFIQAKMMQNLPPHLGEMIPSLEDKTISPEDLPQ